MFSPQYFRSLLCVSRTDIIGFCWYSAIALRVATAVLGTERRCVSYHNHNTALRAHSVVFVVQEYTLLTGWVSIKFGRPLALGRVVFLFFRRTTDGDGCFTLPYARREAPDGGRWAGPRA